MNPTTRCKSADSGNVPTSRPNKIGEQLDAIVRNSCSRGQQRFGIEKQTSDMLDEMLSSIPNVERTSAVLAAIHTEIERYKQLRNEFSVFDGRGNALMPAMQAQTLNLSSTVFWN